MLFGDVLWNFELFQNMLYTSQIKFLKKIEKSCFNHSVDRADEENIIASWDNDLFSSIYDSSCYKISSNIEPNCLVDNNEFAEKILKMF